MFDTTSADVSGLAQIALTVSNVAQSTPFYRDAIGLRFLFAAGPNLAFFDIGGVRLMLAPPEGRFTAGVSSVLYLRGGAIAAAHSAMKSRGVTFANQPHLIPQMPHHALWLCQFLAPDRTTLPPTAGAPPPPPP